MGVVEGAIADGVGQGGVGGVVGPLDWWQLARDDVLPIGLTSNDPMGGLGGAARAHSLRPVACFGVSPISTKAVIGAPRRAGRARVHLEPYVQQHHARVINVGRDRLLQTTDRCESLVQGTTRSELFRRMVETYKTKLEEEEFSRLQKKMSGKARKQGIFTEKEVERIVFGDR
jgi:hypothetical protein